MGAETTAEEYGSDGIDTFLVTDRPTAVSNGTGPSGIIFPGRFPDFCSILAQTVWLAYCSAGYFEDASNHTGLHLSEVLAWTPPENVTNEVTFWPNSTLPQEIIGWSRNQVKLPPHEKLFELDQYPIGFVDWKFVASDPAYVEKAPFPRRIGLEGFVPKPAKYATTGDRTTLVRKVSFAAESIETSTNTFDSLPPVPAGGMPVIDERFLRETAPEVFATAVSTTNAWPTRGSMAFIRLEKAVAEMARDKMHAHRNPTRAVIMILIFCALNIVIFVIITKTRKT